MTKNVKTLRMTRLRRRVLRRARSRGGGCKSCFRKDSQVRNAYIFASFRKYAFAETLRFRKLCKYDFACFRKLSLKFANAL